MTDRDTVIVTGASRGLGHALCRAYLGRGCHVLPLLRRADGVTFEDTSPGRCTPIIADVASADVVETIRAALGGTGRRVDVLINNAGVAGTAVRLGDVSPEEVVESLNVHCLGVLRCTQAVLPMLASSPRPRVVNISSRVGSLARNAAGEFAAEDISYAYRIAKAAQNMLTLAMSQELRRWGVVVCAVHPGEFVSALNPDAADDPTCAAARLVLWIDALSEIHQGGWYDPREGEIPW